MSEFLGGFARKLYSQNESSQVNELIPRSKFQFSVKINHIDPAANTAGSSSLKTIDTDFLRISSIDMPSHRMNTNTLNQYNRKRIVQTGVEYVPITMVAYDTRDAYVEKFLTQYANYYYKNVMNSISPDPYRLDTTFDKFITDFSQTGYKLQPEKNYIKRLTIERKNSSIDSNIITIFNPIISVIEADTLDYSDSSPIQYRITFEYEGYGILSETLEAPEQQPALGEDIQWNENVPQKGPTQQKLENVEQQNSQQPRSLNPNDYLGVPEEQIPPQVLERVDIGEMYIDGTDGNKLKRYSGRFGQ